MSGITTHILDVSQGRPAAGVAVRLEASADGREWREIGEARTDADGRAKQILQPGHPLNAGHYRLSFESGEYFQEKGVATFYPAISIAFEIKDPAQHYHVPLLLSPFGYSTYRGS